MKTDMLTNRLLTEEHLMRKIHYIRGHRVIMDADLSKIFGVETKTIKVQAKKHIERFPDDFMFELTPEEYKKMKIFLPYSNKEIIKNFPLAFTQQGIAMLSVILKSKPAVQVSIQILRIFTALREMLIIHKDVFQEIEAMKHQIAKNDECVWLIFEYLKRLEVEAIRDSGEQKDLVSGYAIKTA